MNALSKRESAQLEEKVHAIDAGLKALDDLGLSMVLKPDAITWNGKVHPIAEAFPSLNKKELAHMAKSIKEIGLQEPVVLTPDGTLLDGRNRIAACNLAGVDIQFRVCPETDPLHFIIAMNITRRHLTASQRGMIGADLKPYFKDAAKKRQRKHAGTAPGKKSLTAARREVSRTAADDVVSMMNEGCAKGAERVSLRMVERAARVKKANPDLAESVLAGTMTLNAAERQITKASDVGQPEAKTKSEYINVEVQSDDDERAEWLERGRALAAKDRKAQLALSDWINEGLLTLDLMRQMFEHVEWEFLVHIDQPKILKSLRKQRTVWSKLIKQLETTS